MNTYVSLLMTPSHHPGAGHSPGPLLVSWCQSSRFLT